jgi:hypothetical protein
MGQQSSGRGEAASEMGNPLSAWGLITSQKVFRVIHMKITDLKSEFRDGRKRVSAIILWENSQRSPMELFIETDEAFATGLDCNGDAFLTACILPALHHGEDRLHIDAAVSPEIKNGLMDAQGWILYWWYPLGKKAVEIEARETLSNSGNPIQPRTGMFFSGGVDSLASLRSNRLTFDNGHPLSVKDGFVVFGLETDQEEKFIHVLSSLRFLAEDSGIDLVPVYTNIRYLDEDWMFWERKFHDAVFAAIAHAFHQRLTVMNISSSYDIPNMQKCGTHPVLDIAYSTYRLRILHANITLSRLEKIRLIGKWPTALDNMRVCNRSEIYERGMLNCGECWKCVKTRLALMCLGLSRQAGAFPEREITQDLLESACQIYPTTASGWEELIQPLKKIGRDDLAAVIERKMDRHNRQMEKAYMLAGIRRIAKRCDEKYFHGTFRKLSRRRKALDLTGIH